MTVVFAESAKADLDRIWADIAADNPKRAISFVRELIAQCKRLSNMPNRYSLLLNHESTGIRRMPYRAYLIFYRVGGRDIEVLRVLNGAQDHEAILFPGEA